MTPPRKELFNTFIDNYQQRNGKLSKEFINILRELTDFILQQVHNKQS